MKSFEEKVKDAVLEAEQREFMELRDKFAIAALQGVLAGGYQGEYVHAAHHAYYYAEEMLKARETA